MTKHTTLRKLGGALIAVCVALTPARSSANFPTPDIDGPADVRFTDLIERFDPEATGFDPVNAYIAEWASALSYLDYLGLDMLVDTPAQDAEYELRLRDALIGHENPNGSIDPRGWGFERVTVIHEPTKDVEGYIASNHDVVIIAFRGLESNTVLDALAVLDVKGVAGNPGLVHKGFNAKAAAVVPLLVEHLNATHRYRERNVVFFPPTNGFIEVDVPGSEHVPPIWCVGDSLGGAMATLTAFRLRMQHAMPVRGVYTFGSPMVGNAQFAAGFLASGLQMHRVVNDWDVPAQYPGDFARLPTVLSGVRTDTRAFINANWQEPLRTPLRTLYTLIHNGLASSLGWANLVVTAASGTTYTHFGQLRYFNRNGTRLTNPTTATIDANRRANLAEGFRALFGRFRLVLAPAPALAPVLTYPARLAAWTTDCAVRTARALQAIGDTLANPDAFLDSATAIYSQGIGDHGPLSYLPLILTQIPFAEAVLLPEPPGLR